ncbi:MAG TPA: S-layer homology domain-containing protein [Firmicutes bacterium]|nr:S-layer homology domain-containing protein [Bacillota bacterium]
MSDKTVTLTGGSAATIPAGQEFFLQLDSSNKLKLAVESNATLTVAGKLTASTGSELALAGKLDVASGGIVRVASTAKITGAGTITNSGTVTLHSSGTNNASVAPAITLASGGAVYSQFEVTDGKIGPSGNVSHSNGSYTVAGVTENDGSTLIQFTERYTYYTPSHGGSSGSSGYAITVPSNIKNGDVTVSPSRATAGTVVTITVKPDAGYELDSLTVTDKNGKTVALKDIGSNKYTFTMPSGAVKIAAEFVEEAPVSTLPFTDVAADAWYYDAVEYVYDNDLMNGTAPTVFAPNATLTRGMLATVLWRMEGSPVVNYALPFEDVSADQWYTEAIRWAASVGVVNGTSATTYAPNANITREQLATMLYRYAAYKSGSVSASASLSGFTDAGSVSDYAADAMEWAVAEEIIGGMTSTTLVPQGSATRAQTATMLMRYCENVL